MASEAAGVTSLLRTATRKTVGRMPASMESAFRVGDQILRQLMDLVSGGLDPDWLEPRASLQATIQVLGQSAELLSLFMPGHERTCDWREMQNKLAAYKLFERADRLLVAESRELPLAHAVQALESDGASSLFVLEGLGHYLAEVRAQSSLPFQRPLAEDFPSPIRIPLHAGMGMSFAARALSSVSLRTGRAGIHRAITGFLARCHDNSCPGYARAAFEPLGFVARNLHPYLVRSLDGAISEIDPALAGFFWHGIGRALYFAPTHFVPCGTAHERAIRAANTEPPSQIGKKNAMAGLIWATTLVNIRDPQVLQALWKSHAGRIDAEAFTNGIISALMLCEQSTPTGFSILEEFVEHKASDLVDKDAWERLVRRPALIAGRLVSPRLAGQGRMDEIFRYHPLPALMQLAGASPEEIRVG